MFIALRTKHTKEKCITFSEYVTARGAAAHGTKTSMRKNTTNILDRLIGWKIGWLIRWLIETPMSVSCHQMLVILSRGSKKFCKRLRLAVVKWKRVRFSQLMKRERMKIRVGRNHLQSKKRNEWNSNTWPGEILFAFSCANVNDRRFFDWLPYEQGD